MCIDCHGRGRGFESRSPRHCFQALVRHPENQSGFVLVQKQFHHYWTNFDLLPDNKPVGKNRLTSLSCAGLLSAVAADICWSHVVAVAQVVANRETHRWVNSEFLSGDFFLA